MSKTRPWIRKLPIAHRGLHATHKGIIENSMSAFEAAVAHGYAIELDVQVTSDGDAVVFHDERLERLTESSGKVRRRTSDELSTIPLSGTNETIPTLKSVFDMVQGRVPILVEIKNPTRKVGKLEGRVADLLSSYAGEAAVQSFNPLTLQWFHKNAPQISRGLLASDYRNVTQVNMSRRARFIMSNLLLSPLGRPNFIGYDVDALPAFAPALMRKVGFPLLAWTVRTDKQRVTSARHADNIIFEGFEAPIG